MQDVVNDVIQVIKHQAGIEVDPDEVIPWIGYNVYSVQRDGKHILCIINPVEHTAIVMSEYLH